MRSGRTSIAGKAMKKRRIPILLVIGLLGLYPGWGTADELIPLGSDMATPSPPTSRPTDIKGLKQAIATDPNSAGDWTELGWLLYREGRYAEAEWALQKALALKPNDPYILWLAGIASYVMGDFVAAKASLQKLYFDFKRWPDNVEMHVTYDLLGRINLQQGELFNAAYYFSKAADLEPGNWRHHFLYGYVNWHRDRIGDALDAIRKAKALNPEDAGILSMYAHLFAAATERWDDGKGSERYSEAIRATQAAIAADRNNYDNYALLGQIYALQGRRRDAVEAFRQAIALAPNTAGPRYNLAKLLLSQGSEADKAEAENQLIQAIAISPDYWKGPQDAPHIALLVAHLIRSERYNEANAVTQWEKKRNADRAGGSR